MNRAQKMKIGEGNNILVLNAPAGYIQSLHSLPEGVIVVESANNQIDHIHWFVKTRASLEKDWQQVLDLVKENVICWICYPKGSSGIQTDLTRDSCWEKLKEADLQWINLISLDATWSAFGIRKQTAKDIKRAARPKERPVLDYVDAIAKTVKLPEDLAVELAHDQPLLAYFNSLAFSHKREYIEWIVSARREETRNRRINGTIERLKKGWKNPANR